ncbi:hypothetical protein DICVIV_14398 [Dictyocaulus viviparus]|uniref:Uncharacterized protein n=1 Tax=Dictyocaulus viviparus TaxID=29172 RepID=A0A0D8XB74_DICVI|nr:hypothetical protein DICVIV_14398 [Dictyocaulus viviparus]
MGPGQFLRMTHIKTYLFGTKGNVYDLLMLPGKMMSYWNFTGDRVQVSTLDVPTCLQVFQIEVIKPIIQQLYKWKRYRV